MLEFLQKQKKNWNTIRSSEIFADKTQKMFQKGKFENCFHRLWKFFLNGGNLKQREMHNWLKGMDASVGVNFTTARITFASNADIISLAFTVYIGLRWIHNNLTMMTSVTPLGLLIPSRVGLGLIMLTIKRESQNSVKTVTKATVFYDTFK